MDKPINDFAVIMGNNMDDELETYKLFTIEQDPKMKNNRVLLTLRAKDVPVRRTGGWFLMRWFFRLPFIANQMDLMKKREVSVADDLYLPIKDGKPSISLALPDTYDKLPLSVKQHPILGALFKMFYDARDSRMNAEEILKEAGYQQSEINDLLSQSQTRLNEFMIKNVQDWTQGLENSMKQKATSPKGEEQKPQAGGINYY